MSSVCYTYKINGMHCAACELLIEDEVSKIDGVTKVDAKLSDGIVEVEISDTIDKSKLAKLINSRIESEGYSISNNENTKQSNWGEYFYAIPIALIIFMTFLVLKKVGLDTPINSGGIDLLGPFLLGIFASLSTCSAVVGGLILSLNNSHDHLSKSLKYIPHYSFHISRLVSFFLFGGLLGLIGSTVGTTPTFTFILNIVVGIVMLFLGIGLLFPSYSFLQLRMPKQFSRAVLETRNINSIFLSIALGAITFFLPCGFTQSVQVIALSSQNILQSASVMLSFALGTLPVLSLLSFATIKFTFSKNGYVFNKVAGLVVILFAFYTILSVLGLYT